MSLLVIFHHPFPCLELFYELSDSRTWRTRKSSTHELLFEQELRINLEFIQGMRWRDSVKVGRNKFEQGYHLIRRNQKSNPYFFTHSTDFVTGLYSQPITQSFPELWRKTIIDIRLNLKYLHPLEPFTIIHCSFSIWFTTSWNLSYLDVTWTQSLELEVIFDEPMESFHFVTSIGERLANWAAWNRSNWMNRFGALITDIISWAELLIEIPYHHATVPCSYEFKW